jgi:hypothetical protein
MPRWVGCTGSPASSSDDGILWVQALVATLTHDERLKDGDEVYFQFALLYTTTDGHRRIR